MSAKAGWEGRCGYAQTRWAHANQQCIAACLLSTHAKALCELVHCAAS